MVRSVVFELDMPEHLRKLRFPRALNARLQRLLDRQSTEGELTVSERREAEGLVEVAELVTLLRLRTRRLRKRRSKE